MKRIIALTLAPLSLSGALSGALSVALSGPAQAGSLDQTVVETPPEPAMPAPPVLTGGDWTGAYGGLSFGSLSVDEGDLEDREFVYGAFGGYDHDFGQLVLGAELDFQAAEDFDLDGLEIDNITRLKLRGGYDAGAALIYATAGGAQANSSEGDFDGSVYGLGLDYMLTEQLSVGAEYLRHDFNDVGDSSTDLSADTISLRGAFRF